jgi:hypothetical protein
MECGCVVGCEAGIDKPASVWSGIRSGRQPNKRNRREISRDYGPLVATFWMMAYGEYSLQCKDGLGNGKVWVSASDWWAQRR